jgi:signal transduction histidine kinase
MVADANAVLGRAFVDLKEAQAQLVQSEKLATIGQLTAGLVHEVNNPMNFIAGNLEHLEKYAGDLIRLAEKAEGDQDVDLEFIKADLPDLLRDLKEGVVRAQKIIGDLKAFSARDRGEGSQIDLKDLVEPALNLLRYQWGKEIRIIKHYEEMPAVECSAGQIGQIVMNLLVNAFEAIKESGREGVVEITVTSDGDWGLIRIRDNGKGISAEHLKNLFQPFFSTKDVGKGVGLGLSISQRIAHQHGGSIEVSSEPDAGACFTVRLPLSKSV